MATFVPFNDYFEQLSKGVHQWGTHTFKVALTNSAPVVTNTILANITQISAGNGYTTGGATIANVSVSETSGVATVDGDDVTFTASGGSIANWRYAVIYNDSATSPADALVGYVDNGSVVTIPDGETFTIRWNASGIVINQEAA